MVRAAEWAFSHSIRPIDQFLLDLHARYAAGKEKEGITRYSLAMKSSAISAFSLGLVGSLASVYSGEPLMVAGGLAGGGIVFGLCALFIKLYEYNVDRNADFSDVHAINPNAQSYKAAVKIGRLPLLLPQVISDPIGRAVNDMSSFLYSHNVMDLVKFGGDLVIPGTFLGLASMCYFLDSDPGAPRRAFGHAKAFIRQVYEKAAGLLPEPCPAPQPAPQAI